MKKNTLKNYFFLLAFIYTLGSCNDPVFYTISQEVAPVTARIDGAPSNFALLGNTLYVASGSRLFRYAGWDREAPPGGKIMQIAATGNSLYALCYQDTDSSTSLILKKFNDDKSWTTLSGNTGGYNSIQYIYAAGNILFIGAESSNSFMIFYLDDNDQNPRIEALMLTNGQPASGEISGAVYDGTNYFICTRGRGIYTIGGSAMQATLINDTTHFAGMICLKDGGPVIAITRNGRLHSITTSGKSEEIAYFDRPVTGALTVWRDENNTPQLLLAGRQDMLEYNIDSGYTYGYMEIELDLSRPNGIKEDAGFREPGIRAPTSVIDGDNERFKSTIGKHPVNAIFQAPDGTLFASTQKSGVWSYRQRNGKFQWNAEE